MRQSIVKKIRKYVRKCNGDKSLERRVRKMWYDTPKDKRESIFAVLSILATDIKEKANDDIKTLSTTNTIQIQ